MAGTLSTSLSNCSVRPAGPGGPHVAGIPADPFASNNGLYPNQSQWQGPYRSLNYDYPETAENKWFAVAPRAPLTIDNADEYVAALKAFVEPTMRGMIDAADTWDPAANGWYGMIWQGDGTKGPNGVTDPTSGQEAILGAFSGQVITQETFREQLRR